MTAEVIITIAIYVFAVIEFAALFYGASGRIWRK